MMTYVTRIVGGLVASGIAVFIDNRQRKRDKLNDRIKRERKKWSTYHSSFRSLMSNNETGIATYHAPDTKYSQPRYLPEASAQLQIVNEQGDVVLTLHETVEPESRAWQHVRSSAHPISRLNPLLSAAPSAGLAGHVAKSGYYIVKIEGPLMRAAGGGFRAMSKAPNGRFQAHAKLFKADQLNTMAAGATLWQIASVALAQKHLHDISSALEIIESGIREIIKYQETERRTKILGTIRKFKETLIESHSGEISSDPKGMIDVADIELMQIEEHLKSDLERVLCRLKGFSRIDFSSNSAILTTIRQAATLLQEVHLCSVARMCGCQILGIASESQKGQSGRIQRIRDSHKQLFEENVCAVFDSIEQLLSKDEASFWNALSEVEPFLDSIHQRISPVKVESALTSFRELQIMVEVIAQKRSAPDQILIKAEEGKVVEFSIIDGLIEK